MLGAPRSVPVMECAVPVGSDPEAVPAVGFERLHCAHVAAERFRMQRIVCHVKSARLSACLRAEPQSAAPVNLQGIDEEWTRAAHDLLDGIIFDSEQTATVRADDQRLTNGGDARQPEQARLVGGGARKRRVWKSTHVQSPVTVVATLEE